MVKKLAFAAGDYIVYPSHGVGRISGIETQSIAGSSSRCMWSRSKTSG